jgi:hypothetical protein
VQTQRVAQPRFPAQRAFVVQLAAAAPSEPDVPLGRVEHVVSGQAAPFASWAECVAFIEQVVAAEPPPTTP